MHEFPSIAEFLSPEGLARACVSDDPAARLAAASFAGESSDEHVDVADRVRAAADRLVEAPSSATLCETIVLLAVARDRELATLTAAVLTAGRDLAGNPATLADARAAQERLTELGHASTRPALVACRTIASLPASLAAAAAEDVRALVDDYNVPDGGSLNASGVFESGGDWMNGAFLGRLAMTPAHATRLAAESATTTTTPATAATLATQALGDASITITLAGREHRVRTRVDAEFELLIVDDLDGGLEGVELRLTGIDGRPIDGAADTVRDGHADLPLAELSADNRRTLTLAARRPS
jgi:hypothetical protein